MTKISTYDTHTCSSPRKPNTSNIVYQKALYPVDIMLLDLHVRQVIKLVITKYLTVQKYLIPPT